MPAMMAIISPEAIYSPATFQPNRPKSITTATSLMVGAAIRKEKVTPSGMPLSTKPIKSGTAEQEQKGVTMPSMAASTLPMPLAFATQQRPGAFRAEEGAHDRDQEDHPGKQQQDLGHIVQEKGNRIAQVRSSGQVERTVSNPIRQRLDQVVSGKPGSCDQRQQSQRCAGELLLGWISD